MKVLDPHGVAWRVKRRWLPWRLRRRDVDEAADVFGSVGPDDPVALVIWIVALLVVFVLPVVLILGVLVAELFLLLLLVPLVVLLRVVRIGRWPIEIWREDELFGTGGIRGWRASGRRLRAIAADLRLGASASD